MRSLDRISFIGLSDGLASGGLGRDVLASPLRSGMNIPTPSELNLESGYARVRESRLPLWLYLTQVVSRFCALLSNTNFPHAHMLDCRE